MSSAAMEGPDEAGTITLKGELTIQYASRLKEALLGAMRKTSHLSLDVEGVEEVDLSCLQVLCAAHRSALASGKELIMPGPWPEFFRRVVEEASFTRGNCCRSQKEISCLWKLGGCL